MVRSGPAGTGGVAALLVSLVAAAAAVAWNVWAGPEWSWDRLQYHLFSGFRLTEGDGAAGFAPAGGQSFLNPIAYLPGWMLARAGLDEMSVSCALAAVHGLCVAAVWDVSRRLFVSMPEAHRDAGVLSALSAACAFLAPVYLLEVGTSYADVTTTLPLLAGVACALRVRQAPGAALGWTLAAGVAMGVAAGLKLSNALAAACGAVLLLQAGPGIVAARLSVFVAGGVLGTALGHGAWGWRLWRDTGNPVFPMFDGWFVVPATVAPSTSAAIVGTDPDVFERLARAWDGLTAMLRISGTRFTPRDAQDWLSFPLRVADPELPPAGAYIETFQPDPRLLLLALVGGALAITVIVRRLRADRGLRAPLGEMAPATLPIFTLFWLAWYAVWAHSSSNGRYAIGLLMLASPLTIAALCLMLRNARARGYALLALVCVQATWALVIADPRGFVSRRSWEDAALQVSVPAELSARPVMHLTGWATSWSFLAPYLPAGSAFVNLDQALEHGVRGLDPVTARRTIDAWQGPLRVLDTATTLQGDVARMGDPQRESIDAWLALWDYAVDPDDCVSIRSSVLPGMPKMVVTDGAGGQSTRDADRVLSCAVRPAPGAAAQARLQTVRHDDLFDAIERRCPAQLGGARNGTRWLGGKAWQRDYPTRGLRLLIAAGKVRVFDELGRGILLGPVDLLRVGVDQLDCTTLTPSRERDRRNEFGTDRGDIDFGGPAPSSQPR